MGRSHNHCGLGRYGEQGDSTQVLRAQSSISQRTDPGVAVPGVCEVQLGFGAISFVHICHGGQTVGVVRVELILNRKVRWFNCFGGWVCCSCQYK